MPHPYSVRAEVFDGPTRAMTADELASVRGALIGKTRAEVSTVLKAFGTLGLAFAGIGLLQSWISERSVANEIGLAFLFLGVAMLLFLLVNTRFLWALRGLAEQPVYEVDGPVDMGHEAAAV